MVERPSRIGLWKLAYEEHAPAVLRFLSRRLANREDAEDLLHETFVRAMGAEGQLRDYGKVRSYLFATAANLLRNHRRHRRVAQPVPLGGEHAELADTTGQPADTAVYLRGLVERLAALVGAMPPAHRMAFQLGLVERLPYREIAERTGWSLGQVKVNVHRARKRAIGGMGEVLDGAVRRHFDGEL